MYIKIPSKEIYEIDNKKIIDNVLKSVSVNAKELSFANSEISSFEFNIYDEEQYSAGFIYSPTVNEVLDRNNITYSEGSTSDYFGVSNYVTFTKTIDITDQRVDIKSIVDSFDKEDPSGIKISINNNLTSLFQQLESSSITSENYSNTNIVGSVLVNDIVVVDSKEEFDSIPLLIMDGGSFGTTGIIDANFQASESDGKIIGYSGSPTYKTMVFFPSYTSGSYTFNGLTVSSSQYVSFVDGSWSVVDAFYPTKTRGTFTPRPFLIGIQKPSLAGGTVTEGDSSDISITFYIRLLKNTIYTEGTYSENRYYFSHRVSISPNILSVSEAKYIYPTSSTSSDLELNSNELVRDSITTDFDGDTVPAYEKYTNLIVDDWQDGKETMTLKVSINNYYDDQDIKRISSSEIVYGAVPAYSNNTYISYESTLYFVNPFLRYCYIDGEYVQNNNGVYLNIIDSSTFLDLRDFDTFYNSSEEVFTGQSYTVYDLMPMTFSIDDVVVPYKRNSVGADVPVSYYEDGTPKRFRVVSIKPVFDGASWQILKLQELKAINLSIIRNSAGIICTIGLNSLTNSINDKTRIYVGDVLYFDVSNNFSKSLSALNDVSFNSATTYFGPPSSYYKYTVAGDIELDLVKQTGGGGSIG